MHFIRGLQSFRSARALVSSLPDKYNTSRLGKETQLSISMLLILFFDKIKVLSPKGKDRLSGMSAIKLYAI